MNKSADNGIGDIDLKPILTIGSAISVMLGNTVKVPDAIVAMVLSSFWEAQTSVTARTSESIHESPDGLHFH